jgi:hypothetical protein
LVCARKRGLLYCGAAMGSSLWSLRMALLAARAAGSRRRRGGSDAVAAAGALLSALCSLGAAAAAAAAAVPAPPPSFSYRDVGFDSGGWVTGLYVHNSTGIVYQRTDVGGAYRSDDGGLSWTWLSGNFESADYAWETQGLAVNQSDASGQTVLTSVGSGAPAPSSGVYKSTDGGATWARKLSGLAANSNCFTRHASPVLAIDDARPWRVWAAMQQGLWRSLDGGESFTPVAAFNAAPFYPAGSDGCEHGQCPTMALVSLVPPDAAGNADPALAGHVLVGAHVMGLAFSADDGASWKQLSVEAGTLPAAVNITTPWRVHRMPNGTAFVAADVAAGGPAGTTGGVWRVDAPSAAAWADPLAWTWRDITPRPQAAWGFWGLVDTPLGFDGGLLVVAASAPDTIFTSRDGGASWVQRRSTVAFSPPCWQPAPGQSQLLPYGRNNVVTSSRNAGAWLISTGFGVAVSRDEGNTWGWASEGLGEVVTFRCHSHPATANWTWCGAGDLTGFFIADAGASGGALAAFAAEPTRWAVDFGHGAAWHSFEAGSRGLSFPGGFQLGASLGQWIVWPDPLTRPTTMTWVAGANSSGALSGIALQWVGLLQSGDDPADLLLLTSSGDYSGTFAPWNASLPPAAYSGGLVRSRNGGASWTHIAQQPPRGYAGTVWYDVAQLALDGGDTDARWWALATVGLLLSRDRGEHWAAPLALCAGAAFAASIAADSSPVSGGNGSVWLFGAGPCFAAGGEALRHTRYFGQTWEAVGNFSAPFLAPLAVHASGRLALVAFAGADATPHVHASLDGGVSWTAVDVASRGHFLAPGVSGLEWDALDPSVLYVSCNGHSVVVVKFDR